MAGYISTFVCNQYNIYLRVMHEYFVLKFLSRGFYLRDVSYDCDKMLWYG